MKIFGKVESVQNSPYEAFIGIECFNLPQLKFLSVQGHKRDLQFPKNSTGEFELDAKVVYVCELTKADKTTEHFLSQSDNQNMVSVCGVISKLSSLDEFECSINSQGLILEVSCERDFNLQVGDTVLLNGALYAEI